jgi:hypothetical protein
MTFRLNLTLPHGWAKNRPMKWFSTYAHRNISENKSFEWQTDYFGWNELFSFNLDLIPTGSDHASVGFSLTLLGFMVDCKIYDSRHWDHDTNSWEKYDEESNYHRMARDERERADQLELARQLLKEDDNRQTRKSVEEFLESPQGQALIDSKVKAKLAEIRQSKDAKRARGEAYKAANLAARDGDQ